ncbi:GNVR domain-containing protein [Aquirufa sp. LEPPI-3A]|uniref:GNVR domain-containing protein n=1 Tax=Aquirufa regiilacus TaxID=3024868 RepID=UPI0028DFBE97|nr:GNVR domain-containing protein [Aquirufa sp. LEPPI-3A]MDT8887195.1 GNVR domain-containing protein [Aquirufa sp. LEPPI-3A]
MNEQNVPQPTHSDEIAINFSEIWNAIVKYKLTLLLVTVIFTAAGALLSLTLDSEYESQVKLLPEVDSKLGGSSGSGGLGGLSSLAGLAGINLSGAMAGSEVIQPAMYPEIVQSIPFLLELSQSQVYNLRQKKFQKLADYLKQDNSNAPIPIFKKDKSQAANDLENITVPKGVLSPDLINISKQESTSLKELREAISVEVDKKNNLIKITAITGDPVVSANLANLILIQLRKYIVQYRTEKARKELDFLMDRQAEARKRYDQSLFTLSNYKDQNRNVFLNVAKDQGKKLQYEVDLAFNVYSNLTNQTTEAKIKLQKETPVFKVLEPAQIPLKRSSPKRSLITLGAMFLGLFASLVGLFLKTANMREIFVSRPKIG